MRIIKHSFIVILILGGLVLIVNQAFLYSSNTTHPYLTEQIVKFYNYYYDPDITPQQLEQMENGSIHEDFGDRSWWYHFYDPIYNVGTGGLTAKAWAQNPEKQVGIPGGDHSWQTAIKDYNVGYKQKAFYSLGHILHLIEDMAVPAHTRNDTHYNGGDPLENWAGNLPKDSTFYNIAQPLIDKGVKPKNFNNLNTYFDELANFSNRNFFSKQSIKDTIVESRYSRPKIVKEIFNTKYIGYAYGKIDDYTRLIRLLKIEKDDRGNKTYFLDDTTPEIHADYFSILSKEAVINGAGVVKLFFDNITEPAAEIVEPEKQLSFWQKIGNSIAGGVKFVISVVDGLIHAPYSAIESAIEESILEVPSQYLTTGFEITKEIMNNVQDEPEVKPPISPQGGFTSGLSDNEAQEEKTFLVKKVIDGDTIVLDNGQEIRYIGIDAPEFPSGCFAQEATNKNKELLEGKQIRLEKDVSEVDKYGRLLRYVYLDLLFINDYLVRNGYVYDFAYEPDVKYKTQFVDAEKEAKENRRGLWGDICHPIVVQGQKTGVGGDVGISETLLAETQNQSQNQGSPSQPEQPSSPEEQSSASEGIPGDESFSSSSEGVQGDNQQPRDIMPPDVLINPLIYNYASSSLTIQWFSSEIPSVFFDIEYKQGEGEWQNLLENTNDVEITFSITNKDITYYFRVRGRDLFNNQSEWQKTSIKILSMPVVINEIAWMGTEGSPQDEWIELFNRANYDIDLTGWILKANDNSPEIIFGKGDDENRITINKMISAQGYYLLERTNDSTTNQPADWYGSFGSGGLNNSGEILELRDDASNLIDSVNSWYAGNNDDRKTMERINPAVIGTESQNWKTYVGSSSGTTDAKGNSIFGTPKAKNSVYKLFTVVTKNITEDTIWTLDNSPYLVYDNSGGSNELLEITEGVTLTIEPGVIVKFVNPGLKVFGTIKAEGIADNPIVFTDYNDKEYAGNVLDSIASPSAGVWSGIWITKSSVNSVFDNIIIRYAGSRTRPFRSGSTYSLAAVGAAIRVENTSITLKNSTIENNLFRGIWLVNSLNTIIDNSIFQNHLEYDSWSQSQFNWDRNMAIYIDNSTPQIRNSSFQNNITGVSINNNSRPVIENNNFSNNSYPVWNANSYSQFLDNQLENNYWDGIVLMGMKLNQDYALGGGPASSAGGSVFINYQEIPSWGIVVPEEYTLTIEPGTIIKSVYGTSGLIIEGTLIAEGTAEKPIIFTSLYDDKYGGDTNGDGNTSENDAKPGAWGQIVFTQTSINSSLNHVVIRCGGMKWIGSPNFQKDDYVLDIKNSNVTIANSIIENNTSGVYLENSNSQITNTIFQNHQYKPFSDFTSTGLYLSSSRPTIDISTFLNNKLGIYIDINSWLDIDLAGLIFGSNDKDFEDLRPEEEGL